MKQARQGRAVSLDSDMTPGPDSPEMGEEMEYLKGGGRDLISCHFLAIFKSQRTV